MLAAFVPVLVALTTLSLLSTTSFFFFNATATPEIYTLSLHDALPISFLTAEQHRQLYDWIDASLFQTEPEYYDSFVLCALKAPVIQRIYDKPLLASVLRQLLTHDACGGYEVNQLKERFYSKEEMEADRKATAEQEEQEKERQWQQQVMKCQEKLASCYNVSAESLIQFIHGYHFGGIRKAELGMVYDKLLEWPEGCAQT